LTGCWKRWREKRRDGGTFAHGAACRRVAAGQDRVDPGRKVNELFAVQGIPNTFVYDRAGKLVAQSIDMRTGKQFLEMLAQAGLR
jgi:hypothetical protein